jgi:hypothetical protein
MAPDAAGRAFDAARADYQRDPRYETCLPWFRALRAARRADDAIALMMTWKDKVTGPVQSAQIGIFCNDVGLFAEAEGCLSRALPALAGSKPNSFLIMAELAIAKALQGDYEGAQALQSATRTWAEWEPASLTLAVPGGDISGYADYLTHLLENDMPVEGKRVLVAMEGGVGDQIWAFRYARDLMAQGAHSVGWPSVAGLEACFTASQSGVVVGEQFEYELALRTFGLSARYQHSPDLPSYGEAYLVGGPARLHGAPPDLPVLRGGDRPRVGLIWRSTSSARHEPFRSMALPDLEPILEVAGLEFQSLQVSALGDAERRILSRRGIAKLGGSLADFGDTAARLSEIDLLITVDTAAAHLAGAMGVPVWVLLAQACDSRWGADHRFTPWYPSMRLYRQDRLGDWSRPLAEMAADLARL